MSHCLMYELIYILVSCSWLAMANRRQLEDPSPVLQRSQTGYTGTVHTSTPRTAYNCTNNMVVIKILHVFLKDAAVSALAALCRQYYQVEPGVAHVEMQGTGN